MQILPSVLKTIPHFERASRCHRAKCRVTVSRTQAFRQRCIDNFQQTEALDTMIVTLQETASAIAGAGQ